MESIVTTLDTENVSFEIYIAFENSSGHEGFLTGFGLSFLIFNRFTENYLLFDTGSDGKILSHNIEQFDVDYSEISKIVISHNHAEHSGGLKSIYEKNSEIEIYVPVENLNVYRRTYPEATVVGVSEFKEIDTNIYTTGQLGNYLKEQALFLRNFNDDLMVLVGCSHPGLDEIITMARSLGKVKAVLGGFHNFRNFICLEGIEFIGPCHCTQHLNLIKERFPGQYNEIIVGNALPF
ncbi:MAG: MBL fold metallo-hydrolase [Candidatus Hermodarchaeota archaeon]